LSESITKHYALNFTMRSLFSISLFLLSLFAAVHATPTPGGGGHHEDHACLSDQEANKLLYIWISFFEHIDAILAEATLTPDFQLTSTSVNFLEGLNYDAVTGPNRTAFIEGEQLTQAAAPKEELFTVLDTIHSCNTVWFRWVDNSSPIPFFGFDEFYLKKVGGKWMIYKAFSEFNNAAALYNAGVFPCPSG